MDPVDKVILWDYTVVVTSADDGDGELFKGRGVITIGHDVCVRIGINVNVGDELKHEPNTASDPEYFILEGNNLFRICITGSGALHFLIPRSNIRAQLFWRENCTCIRTPPELYGTVTYKDRFAAGDMVGNIFDVIVYYSINLNVYYCTLNVAVKIRSSRVVASPFTCLLF